MMDELYCEVVPLLAGFLQAAVDYSLQTIWAMFGTTQSRCSLNRKGVTVPWHPSNGI
jgi:hypothetical protein